MSESRRPLRRDGPLLPTPTRLLYLAGPSTERDATTLQQLSSLTGQVQLTTAMTQADVQQRIRTGGYHALVISHALPQADTLALISSLRKANAPIAIVPVVTETQRDLYASAVAVGADDVLILLGGTLLHPTETLVRVRQSRYLPAHEVEAVRAAIRGVNAPVGSAATRGPVAPPGVETPPEALANFSSEAAPAPDPVREPVAQPPAAATPPPGPMRNPPRPEAASPTFALLGHAPSDPVRRDLEARLSQAEAEAASRREAHAALVASKLDLERAVQAHRSERDGWERQRKEWLATVQRTNDAHAAERSKWEEARLELERRATDADQAAQAHRVAEMALQEARSALRAADHARATEREDWARERAQIETRMQETAAARRTNDASEAVASRTQSLEADLVVANAALDAGRAASAEARAEADRMREGLTVVTHARDQLERALDAARAELRRLAETRQTEHADLAAARTEAETFRADLAEAAQVRADLEARLDGLRRDAADASSERAALESKVDALRAEAAAAASRGADLEAALDAVRADMASTTSTRVDLERALEATRAERTRLEASLSALGGDLQRAIAAAASDRVALEVASEQLRAQRAEISALDRARQDAEAALVPARADRDTALERETVARGEADAARATIEHLRAEVTALTGARHQVETLSADLATATRARRDLETLLVDAQADRQRLVAERQTEQAAWAIAREALERRLREAESAAGNATELQATLAALTQSQATERMDWMTARLALETRLSQADDELERQREEVEALGAELARVAARYDRLARSELFGYAVTTLDGWLVHCNDAFARLLGYANAREALGSASEHAFGADGTDVISAATLAEGQIRYRDAWLTRVDGVSVRVLQSAMLVSGHAQDPLVERILVDLSDRTALEERLRTAQRLETLGRLTVAMAPELEALAALVDAGSSAPPDPLDEGAEGAASSATVIEIRQLLAYIRKQSRPAGLIDLNDAVERVSPVLARLVSSHVDFTLRLGPTTLIAADEEDFEQMTTALVVAARDWLSAGGSLLVETGTVDVVDTERRPSIGVRSGSGAVLTITAAGYGVQPADPPASLEAVVERCGGSLHVGGVAGRRVMLRVHLPKIR